MGCQMMTEISSSNCKQSESLNEQMADLYVFIVDCSNSMLLQPAPFGQWSRVHTVAHLISRQLFNLSEPANKMGRCHFLTIGFNARKVNSNFSSPKQILKDYPDTQTLANSLIVKMKTIGGRQNTNRGLALMKGIYEFIDLKGEISKDLESTLHSDIKEIMSVSSIRSIKFLFFTDAEDVLENDIESSFIEQEKDSLCVIFVGSNKKQPGWMTLQHILSKCKMHDRKQIFDLDSFTHLGSLESKEFISLNRYPQRAICPLCVVAEQRKAFVPNEEIKLNVPVLQKENEKDLSEKSSKNQITGELIISAGPRKDDDVQLGEDAGGVIVGSNWASFWVADGTSESPTVMDFSSRTMAQELGIHFVEELNKVSNNDLLNNLVNENNFAAMLLEKAFNSLLKEWDSTLSDVLKTERGRKTLNGIFKLDDQKAMEVSRTHFEFIDFSSTFLCGLVSNKGIGQVALIGDCPLCIGNDDGLKVYRLSNNRIFARMRRIPDGYRFDPSDISGEIITKKFTDTNIIVTGSDGIGKLPEFLEAQMKSFSWPDIRKRIHKFIPKSHDDKTFCLIHIKRG